MIRVTGKGNYDKTTKWLQRMLRGDLYADLDRYGQEGVALLASVTPVDTGLTAQSWNYRVHKGKRPSIEWYNTNLVNGVPVAILIQYGHGTGSGGYVQGRDFINPAIQVLFDRIADDVWKKVRS